MFVAGRTDAPTANLGTIARIPKNESPGSVTKGKQIRGLHAGRSIFWIDETVAEKPKNGPSGPRRRWNSFPPSILNQRVEAAFGGWNPKRKT